MRLSVKNIRTLVSRPPDKRLVFYHLPKTAGSSLRASLGTLYFDPMRPHRRPYFIYSGRASLRVSQLTGESLLSIREKFLLLALSTNEYRFIAAHQPFSKIAAEEFAEETLYMSILREPVSRFISLYFYNRYKTSSHSRIECSLDEYIDSEDGRMAASTYVEWLGRARGGRIENDDERVSQAIANLRSLDVIGLMEDMGGFRLRLEGKLNRKVPVAAVNKNPRKNRMDEVSSHQLRKIEVLCEKDMLVYDEAKKLCSV